MDEEQIAALRRWGDGLRVDSREEVRAAGKAIVLLCDEIDRLEVALWHVRIALPEQREDGSGDERDAEEAFAVALRRRLRNWAHR